MSNVILLLLAGILLFAVSMALFRRRRHGAGPDSIVRGGSTIARLGLVAWWGSLALLAASMVVRAMQG